MPGRLLFTKSFVKESEAWQWKTASYRMDGIAALDLDVFSAHFGFFVQHSWANFFLVLPFWFLVLGSGSLAMICRLRWPWRFKLRGLFIVTTFLAVVLGMIAWLDRAWIGK